VGAPERRTAGPASPRVARRQGQRRLHDMPDAVGTVERAGGEVPFRHPPRSERASYRLRFGAQRFWDLTVYPKAIFPWSPEYGGRPLSALTKNHLFRLKFIGTIHVLALGAPFCFSWGAFRIFLITMAIASFGMTASFHRQCSHRSFACPKWLEYTFALMGCQALEGAPIGWARIHRYHHVHSDKEHDVHSPVDGVLWSHVGHLFDPTTSDKLDLFDETCPSNVADLQKQAFYRLLDNATVYAWLSVWLPVAALFALGGLPYVIWGFCLRVVWVWHVTWSINSFGHICGYQSYRSGDNSMNNHLLGILGFGDGYHNNHHAFPSSARHGFEWYETDVTWWVLWSLSKVGLVWNLRLPTVAQRRRRAIA